MERIGKYEILDKIGEGGFGVVYHGRDPFIKRDVALKTCTSKSEDVRRRFFREAEIAGNLHHPNIVTIHDFGLDEDLPYLVQEYLSGEDLDSKIASGSPLPYEQRVAILEQVAQALAYAHKRGVIHRDVKPANIRILESGRVKVMDFGIARLKDQETQLTRTGTTLGTVAYLSPEQLRGKGIDHRADLFSFGVVAYELLSGRRPFDAPTLPQLFYALVHQAPTPLRERAPECPAGLERLVHRCLEKSPVNRYASFDELLPDLRGALNECGSASSQPVADGTVSLPPELASGRTGPTAGPDVEEAPSIDRLAVELDRALADEDVEEAERLLDAARRAHGASLVEATLGRQAASLARLVAARDEGIRQAAALLIGDSDGSLPTDEIPAPDVEEPGGEAMPSTQDLLAQAWRRIESLLESRRIEEAGIHVSRLRPLLANHPTFRRLERRVKAARQSKRAGQGGPAGSDPGQPGADTDGAPDTLPAEERLRALRRAVGEAEADLRRGRLDAADERLQRAREELGDDETLASLAERIAHVRTLTMLQDLVGRGRKAVAAGDYELGQRLALDALKIDSRHLEAKALFRRAEIGLRRVRRGGGLRHS